MSTFHIKIYVSKCFTIKTRFDDLCTNKSMEFIRYCESKKSRPLHIVDIHYVNGNKLFTGIDGDASERNPLGVTGHVDEVSALPLLHGWQELSYSSKKCP